VWRNPKIIAGVVAVVLVAAGGIAYATSGDSTTGTQSPVIIFSKVETPGHRRAERHAGAQADPKRQRRDSRARQRRVLDGWEHDERR
jgi:hypothetical protein